MIIVESVNSEHKDFQKLVKELDVDLGVYYKDDHFFYGELNTIDKIKYVVVAYEKEIPVGCGGIKEYSNEEIEVRRMFVPSIHRKKELHQ